MDKGIQSLVKLIDEQAGRIESLESDLDNMTDNAVRLSNMLGKTNDGEVFAEWTDVRYVYNSKLERAFRAGCFGDDPADS